MGFVILHFSLESFKCNSNETKHMFEHNFSEYWSRRAAWANSVIAQMHIGLGPDTPNFKVALAIDFRSDNKRKKTLLKRSRNTLSFPLDVPSWVLICLALRVYGRRTASTTTKFNAGTRDMVFIYLKFICIWIRRARTRTQCAISAAKGSECSMFICRSRWCMSVSRVASSMPAKLVCGRLPSNRPVNTKHTHEWIPKKMNRL